MSSTTVPNPANGSFPSRSCRLRTGWSLSNLYKEEWLPEKGVGCIALADLKEGYLVLREVPQLLHPVITDVNFTHEDSVRHHVRCV